MREASRQGRRPSQPAVAADAPRTTRRPSPPVARGVARSARLLLALAAACCLLASCAELSADAPASAGAGLRLVGAFVPGGVWRDQAALRDLEAQVGRPFDVAHWFTSWDHAYDDDAVHELLAAGRTPLISWQPHGYDVRDIAAGRFDAYLRGWARGVRESPGLVYLRPFPEMNGDWVDWNGDPAGLRAAWTHMTSVFEAEGAVNVRWVWSPNVRDEPATAANRMENYYPGDDQVDVFGLSGYNWGDTRPYIGWRSFSQIVEAPYERLVALGPQPIWVTETASSEDGGDKADWIRDMFATEGFPRLEAIVWFNEAKEADWRLESSAAALAAFAEEVGKLDGDHDVAVTRRPGASAAADPRRQRDRASSNGAIAALSRSSP